MRYDRLRWRHVFAMIIACVSLVAQGTQAKPTNSAEEARQRFLRTLDAIQDAWFGKPYQSITTARLKGNLRITLSGAVIDQKIDSVTQGQIQSKAKSGNVALEVDSIYFANGDYQTTASGDLGNVIAQRRGNRGFIYSQDQGTYTTAIDKVSGDIPLTYLSWFRQCLNDLKAAYVDGKGFKATLVGEEGSGSRTVQRIRFESPTSKFDSRKREQLLTDTLGFWKRGILELVIDQNSQLPIRMEFQNPEQGVNTRVDFSYGPNKRLQAASFSNNSVGFQGPGYLRLGYNNQGHINYLSGELSSEGKSIDFELNIAWSQESPASVLTATPPMTAKKKGKEEFETGVLLGLAGHIFDLQKNGLNLRSIAVSPKAP